MSRHSVTLHSKEGEKIFGMLQEAGERAVIFCHGYASHKIGFARCYVLLGEAIARRGCASFRFDFRGCGDSEGELTEMELQDFVDDILACVKYLEEKGYKKLGIFGSSFGGAMAALAALQSARIQSLALWAPVAKGELVQHDRGVEISQLRADQAMEKLGHLPLLHMHGEEDEVISLEHQEAFREARKGASAKSVFVTYPQTKHRMATAPQLGEVMETISRWFDQTL